MSWLILLLRLLSLILLAPLLVRGPLSLLPLLLIRRATFTVALAAFAVIAASTPPASGFETSGQSVAPVGSAQAPVELFHTDKGTLQVT